MSSQYKLWHQVSNERPCWTIHVCCYSPQREGGGFSVSCVTPLEGAPGQLALVPS